MKTINKIKMQILHLCNNYAYHHIAAYMSVFVVVVVAVVAVGVVVVVGKLVHSTYTIDNLIMMTNLSVIQIRLLSYVEAMIVRVKMTVLNLKHSICLHLV